MDVSLIICTKDRAHYLVDSLNAISNIATFLEWELIVVDNGSTDHTKSVIDGFVKKGTIPIRYIFEPKIGLSAARNTGWKNAKGKFVTITDDDCYVDRLLLNRVWQAFQRTDLGYVAGSILLFDNNDAKITYIDKPNKLHFKPSTFIIPGQIQGANCSFSKIALASVNGFDENLGYGTQFPCADIDIVTRLSIAGWHGTYDPDVIIYHHHRRQSKEAIENTFYRYDIGRGAYYAKFILDKPLRYQALLSWLKSIVQNISKKRIKSIRQEINGAILYIKSINSSKINR